MGFLLRQTIESEKVEGLRPSEPMIEPSGRSIRPVLNLDFSRNALLAAVALFCAAFLLRAYGAATFAQQADERHWVNRSARVAGRIGRGDITVATTHLGHPGIPAALTMAAAQKAGTIWNNHIARGTPSLQVDKVTSSRLGAAALSSLVVPILFLFAMPFVGWPAALLAAVLLSFDPQHIAFSRIAHIDGALVMLVTACVFSFMYSEMRPSLRRTILFGALVGLALSTKPTVIALAPALFAARLLMRYAGLTTSSWIQARDLLAFLVAHLVLLFTWTKLWDPRHNFITFLRVRLQSAEWVNDAGKFLQDHFMLGLLAVAAAVAVPLSYQRFRRRRGRGSTEMLLCLSFIPLSVTLLWTYSLPLENILRFWGWVAGLSKVKHDAYGVVATPQDANYAEIWWRRTPPLFWLGLVLLVPVAVRGWKRPELRGALTFCAIALFIGACWTGILNVSPKQAFRYVMPVYPLLLAASAFALVRVFAQLPRPVPKLALVVGVLPLMLLSASRLPLQVLYLNPLSPSFATAVANGMIPTPLHYDEALELAHAAAVFKDGRPDVVEVIGDLELVRAEYLRRYPPEQQRLYIGPYRGGMGADWILEMKGWSISLGNEADFRMFAERPLQLSHEGIELVSLYRIKPFKNGESRVASVRYSQTRISHLREDPWKTEVRRIVPPEKADYAFFELPMKVNAGTYKFAYPIRFDSAEQQEDMGKVPPAAEDEIILRLEASGDCKRDVRMAEVGSPDGKPVVVEFVCSFPEESRLRLAAFWFNNAPVELGSVRVTKVE